MSREYAVFLRGVSNVPMEPYRSALAGLGLGEVDSFGASGNFVFSTPQRDSSSMAQLIGRTVSAEAFVRTRAELSRVIDENPYRGRAGAAIFLADRRLNDTDLGRLDVIEFEGARPVASEVGVYFVHPTRRRGLKGIVDFERELGVRGTMRAASVIERVFEMM